MMDVSLLGNCNERHETLLLSQTCGSQNELRYVGLDSLPQKQAGCSHFSIRGYVTEVRRRDRRICWPFHEFHNHSNMEKHENLLPPMPVADFRWWDCRGCLSKISPTETIIQDGSMRNSLPCKVKNKGTSLDGNPIVASHATEPRFLSQHQVASGKAPNGRSIGAYGTHTAEIDDQCQPLLFGSNGEQKFDTIKAGQVQRKGMSMSMSMAVDDAIIHEQCKGEEPIAMPTAEVTFASKRKKAVSRLLDSRPGHSMKIGSYINESAPEKLDVLLKATKTKCNMAPMQKETHLDPPATKTIRQSSEKDHGMLKESSTKKRPKDRKPGPLLSGTNNYILKGKTNKSNTGHKFETKLMGSFKEKYVVSKKNNLIGNKILHHKKAQKTRMLNDIMKNAVSGMSKIIPASSKETVIQLDASNSKSQVLKEEDTEGERKLNVSVQKERSKMPKKKKRHLPELDDEGSPLMHWLNRIPEKVKSLKLDAESNFVDRAVLHSKPMGTMPSGKILDCGTKVCGSNQGHNTVFTQGKKQNRMSQVEVVRQNLAPFKRHSDGKRTFVVKDGSRKLNPKIIHTKSARDIPGKRTLLPQLNLNDRPRKKGSMNDKQSKTLQNDNGKYPPVHVTKDSLSISKDGEIGSPKSGLLVPEKPAAQKSNQMSDTADVDGIPVEILKLLQENWLKRRLVSAECSTQKTHELSELTKDTKEGKILNFTKNTREEASAGLLQNWHIPSPNSETCGIGHEMSSALLNNQAGQRSQSCKFGRDAGFAGKGKENSCCELNVDGFHANDKFRSHNMVHHDKFHAITEFREPSHFRELQKGGPERPFINSRGNYCPQNHRLVIQNADSYKDESIPMQDSYRGYPFCQSSVLTSSIPVGRTDSPKFLPDLNHMNNSSQNVLLRQKMTDVALEMGDTKATNAAAIHLQKRKVSDPKSNKKVLHADNISYFDEVNGYGKKIMPQLDLHKNDTFSAMHLLRLMDPAVCSSTPSCSLPARDQKLVHKHPNISCTNQHTELYGAETSARMSRSLMHAIEQENFAKSHYPRKTSNYLSVPRSGFSGSFFLEDSALYFDGYRQPFSYSNYFYDEAQLFPLRGCGKEKQNISCYASQTRPSSQSFMSGDGSMQENVLSLANYASQSKISQRNEQLQLGKRKKVQVVRSANENCRIQLCVLNRNPADFTVPDEGNEYMSGYNDLGPRQSLLRDNKLLPDNTNHQGQQKAMKLTALKGLLRN